MSREHLFEDPLGEVDAIADLMFSVAGGRIDHKDALIYRYRSQRVRRQAIRALEGIILRHEERFEDGRTVPAKLSQRTLAELQAVIDLLRQFKHDNNLE